MPRLLVLAIAMAIAAAIVAIAVALFVLGAAVRRVDCSPALEPPAALQKNLSELGCLNRPGVQNSVSSWRCLKWAYEGQGRDLSLGRARASDRRAGTGQG
jgi:hypothetical protein